MSKTKTLMSITTLVAVAAFVSATSPSFAAPQPIVVNTTAYNSDTDGACSLQEAIENVNADADVSGGDCAAPKGSGVPRIDLTNVGGDTITVTNNVTNIDESVEIFGPGAELLTISGDSHRAFRVRFGASATISDLRIAEAEAGFGGAITVEASSLILKNVVLDNNHATSFGGAIHLTNSTATITDCVFFDNVSGSFAGAIMNYGGTLLVTGSEFITNAAGFRGGAIETLADDIHLVATTTIRKSRFFNNSATDASSGGGAVSNWNQSTMEGSSAATTIVDSYIIGNTTVGVGGGINNKGSVNGKPATTTVTDAVVAGNVADVDGDDINTSGADNTVVLTEVVYDECNGC